MKKRPIRRHQDWDKRLDEFFRQSSGTSFDWGKKDCFMFTVQAIEAMTGTDIAAVLGVRGQYDSKPGACRLLAEKYDGSFENVYTTALGKPSLDNPAEAQRGDVVIVETK